MIKRWLRNFIINTVCDDLTVGAHCGCCGRWIPNIIIERHWAWSVCEDCANAAAKMTTTSSTVNRI